MSAPRTPAERSGRTTTATLVGHLLGEHGRTRQELQGLPLEAMHRFEHLEQELGLIELGHAHAVVPAREAV